MYSVVLLTALTAGGEAGGLGGPGPCGGWWYAPIPYVDVVWPVPLNYAPSPARFAPGGVIGPSLPVAMRWIGPVGAPLSDAENQAWLSYFKDLSPDEQAEVAHAWWSADYDGQRRLLARIDAFRPKDGDKEKEKEKDKEKDD
jgi:hypothetical protein